MSEDKATVLGNFLPQLKNLIESETVFGEPYTIGSVTLIPVNSVKVGFAFGETEIIKDRDNNGGAGAVSLSPVAFIVVKGDSVSIQNLSAGTIESVMEKVPDVVEKFGNLIKKFQKQNDAGSES